MAITNVITSQSINQVDEIITELQESANAIHELQKHELSSCLEFIEQLGVFEDEYKFWQLIQVVVILTVVVWQIVALRSYFITKKLV